MKLIVPVGSNRGNTVYTWVLCEMLKHVVAKIFCKFWIENEKFNMYNFYLESFAEILANRILGIQYSWDSCQLKTDKLVKLHE